MRENWRWDSTATASSSQPDISLPFPLQPRLLLLLHRELLLCPSCLPLFSLLLLILLQLLKILICLVEHLLLSKNSFFPETIFLFTIYVNVTQYHLTSWGRGFEGPVSQFQTWQEHILASLTKSYLWCYNAVCTQRGRRNYPHNLSSAIFIWNIYSLEKVTGGKFAPKLRSDERWARILSQLNSIVLIIAKSQYFQLIQGDLEQLCFIMLILLGNVCI